MNGVKFPPDYEILSRPEPTYAAVRTPNRSTDSVVIGRFSPSSPASAAMRLALFGALAAFVATPAMAQDSKVGEVGPFIIHKISDKGVFNRCAATLQPGKSMLRIAWNKDHDYFISVPTPPGSRAPVMLSLNLGRAGARTLEARITGERTSAKLDNGAVDALMKIKRRIAVDVGPAHFVWPIGNVSMETVFQKVEDCVWKAHGR